jgi:hypothetical protein
MTREESVLVSNLGPSAFVPRPIPSRAAQAIREAFKEPATDEVAVS